MMAQTGLRTLNLMPRLHLILLPSALSLVLPGWVEASPEKAPAGQARPLNLSLPQEMQLHSPASGQTDETVLRNLRAPAQPGQGSNAPHRPTNLPYGAGYEHRHQEMGRAGGAAGSGAGAGNGTGRRGR